MKLYILGGTPEQWKQPVGRKRPLQVLDTKLILCTPNVDAILVLLWKRLNILVTHRVIYTYP